VIIRPTSLPGEACSRHRRDPGLPIRGHMQRLPALRIQGEVNRRSRLDRKPPTRGRTDASECLVAWFTRTVDLAGRQVARPSFLGRASPIRSASQSASACRADQVRRRPTMTLTSAPRFPFGGILVDNTTTTTQRAPSHDDYRSVEQQKLIPAIQLHGYRQGRSREHRRRLGAALTSQDRARACCLPAMPGWLPT